MATHDSGAAQTDFFGKDEWPGSLPDLNAFGNLGSIMKLIMGWKTFDEQNGISWSCFSLGFGGDLEHGAEL